jgi:ABC-type sugar transport system substrate-binding protein
MSVHVRWLRCAAAACAVAMIAAGCGSDSSESSSAGGATTAAERSSGVAEAAKLAEIAKTKLLYGPTTGPVEASQLRAPTAADLQPTSFKPGGPKKTVAIVACFNAGTCAHMADLAKQWFEMLGFSATIFESDYTPAGNQRVMNNALALNPVAIYNIAVQPVTITAQIDKAKAEGIKIVYGTGTAEINKGDLDAYVPQTSNLFQSAAGIQMIGETDGKAKIHWLSAPEFPELEEAAGIDLTKTLCPNCEITEGTVTAAQVTAPVPMGQLITSITRAHPGLDYIELASACADLNAAAAAARSAGGDVKIAGGGCGASAIAAMNAGNIPFATGAVEPMAVLQGIDQILRVINGDPPIPEDETGPAVYLVTPENTPDKSTDGNYGALDRWTLELFDYVTPYSEAWGVDLGKVLATEQ